MAKPLTLAWNKRATRRENGACVIHRWKCKDAQVVVDRITSTLGLSTRWLVVDTQGENEVIVDSTRKTKATAMEKAEKWAAMQTPRSFREPDTLEVDRSLHLDTSSGETASGGS